MYNRHPKTKENVNDQVYHKNRPRQGPAAKKPHPDFPLTRHPRGYWCKKVRGKMSYFGKIADDPEGEKALNPGWSKKTIFLPAVNPRTTGRRLDRGRSR